VDAVVAGELARRDQPARIVSACELVLEGLAAQRRITRSEDLGYVRARPERKQPGHGKGGLDFG
jgi:magnesium chelatase subunit I